MLSYVIFNATFSIKGLYGTERSRLCYLMLSRLLSPLKVYRTCQNVPALHGKERYSLGLLRGVSWAS